MQSRHLDRRRYFQEQAITTRNYVIPFIEEVKQVRAGSRVLEVGCGEGGNMLPFLERGARVTGVDINGAQLERAKEYLSESGYSEAVIIHQDIYKVSPDELGFFDVIFLRDVIEHIPNQEHFMLYIKSFLQSDGIIFFGFPPWQMPFGGHQQVLKGWVSMLPYIHLLPRNLYSALLKVGGVPPHAIRSRMDIRDTGISLERLERCIHQADMKVLKNIHYLTNPNYKTKFGIVILQVLWPFNKLIGLRNIYTTCGYYVVG